MGIREEIEGIKIELITDLHKVTGLHNTINKAVNPIFDKLLSIIEKDGGWVSDSKKLEEGVDYVFHIRGNTMLVFGRYRKVNDSLLYRFGTANGSEDGSMLLNALPVVLPQPPKSKEEQ